MLNTNVECGTHFQMTENAWVAGTRVVPVVLVNPELEALGVDVVCQRLDSARKSRRVGL